MGNNIYAWRAKKIDTKARSHLMDRYDCRVLYDPAEVNDGDGAKYNLGNRQLIVAMSGNKRHARKAALKVNAKAQCYLGPSDRESTNSKS
jgi:hypothetical protein